MRYEATSTILFSSPEIWQMEACMCKCLVRREISHRSVLIEVAVLTLPRFVHPLSAVLLTLVQMWDKGYMHGHNRAVWERRVHSSRPLVFMSSCRLVRDTRHYCVVGGKAIFHTNHCS